MHSLVLFFLQMLVSCFTKDLFFPLQIFFFFHFQMENMKFKDKRMKLMTEILSGIKVGRFFYTKMNKLLIIVLKRKPDV